MDDEATQRELQKIIAETRARHAPAGDDARASGQAVVVEEQTFLERAKETGSALAERVSEWWDRTTSPIAIEPSSGDAVEDKLRQVERTLEAGETLGEVGVAAGETGLEVLAGDVGDFTAATTGTTVTGKPLNWKERAVAAVLAAIPILASSQVRAGERMLEAADDASPYRIRFDPRFPGRPDPAWSIDTTGFGTGMRTARGGTRNAPQFWQEWLEMRPETISDSNRYLIEQLQRNPRGPSPRIDPTWVESFPEHAPFLEVPQRSRTLVHHHVDQGPIAIPVPAPTHVGSGGPWHGFPLEEP